MSGYSLLSVVLSSYHILSIVADRFCIFVIGHLSFTRIKLRINNNPTLLWYCHYNNGAPSEDTEPQDLLRSSRWIQLGTTVDTIGPGVDKTVIAGQQLGSGRRCALPIKERRGTSRIYHVV
jgi:hypothetical protein